MSNPVAHRIVGNPLHAAMGHTSTIVAPPTDEGHVAAAGQAPSAFEVYHGVVGAIDGWLDCTKTVCMHEQAPTKPPVCSVPPATKSFACGHWGLWVPQPRDPLPSTTSLLGAPRSASSLQALAYRAMYPSNVACCLSPAQAVLRMLLSA